MQETIVKHQLTEEEITQLNEQMHPLNPLERLIRLYRIFDADEIMLTSSFAATSALLLKLVSEANNAQKVHFIDTGYHFKETLEYVEELRGLLELEVERTRAERWKHDWTRQDQTWKKDPDFCCSINKVEPLDQIKNNKSIWISGLMKWQSDHRSTLNFFEERGGILKFYPLLDLTREERDDFIRKYSLPFHPLVDKGYNSIGCENCTVPGDDRTGRWNNHPKTECGLHL